MGLLEPQICLTTEWLLNQFSSNKQLAVEQYRRFVSEGLAATTPWSNIKHQLFLGSDAFIHHVVPLLDGHENVTEIPRTQRFANRKPLAALFQGFNIDNRTQRDYAIVRAHVEQGYKLIEIAHHLALHYSPISKIVSHLKSAPASRFRGAYPHLH